MIIIGIDPGIATTGFGVIDKPNLNASEPQAIDYGCIETNPSCSSGERLKKINNELNKLIKTYQPKIMAVESLFFFKNLKTVMPVSQAKGVILFTAAKKKIPIYEFTPLQVKMAITGYGRAEKKQVQEMIKVLLNLKDEKFAEKKLKDDAADALGIALCYVFHSKIINTESA
ncbi:MAG: crossover junction endodeoxyribonuclease RuvC [Patescibacteria group bacterium]|nr:crossover junction endodeoxyribonuclease RuvC [Patescibacteria group bacterium]